MRLTEWQRHLLVCLMEEAAEVQQAAAKLLRFEETGRPTNYTDLYHEMIDLSAITELCRADGVLPTSGEVDMSAACERIEEKKCRVKHYYEEEMNAKQES